MKRIFTLLSVFLSVCWVHVCAENSQKAETKDSIFRQLDEIDVVAVKYKSDFRKEGIAGTEINRDHAERLGVTDIKGMSSIVPNFYIPDYGSRITSSIYVRGIGSRIDQPGTGLTVDNVSFLNKDSYSFDIPDIASMEMLRGPQSILFGRNTMTGLINIRTLSPFDFSGWRTMVEMGPHYLFRFNLGWYHRFHQKFGLSLVGSFYRYGGQFENLYNHLPVDREVNAAFRIKMNWNPSGKVGITNTFSSSILRQGGYAYEEVTTGNINYNDTCFYKRGLINDGLTINYRDEKFEIISVTSIQHIDDTMTLDQDFLPLPYFTLTQKKKETALTEDLIFKGSAFKNSYSWITGVYGFYRNCKMSAPVTFKDEGIKSLIESHNNEYNPYYPIIWNEREFVLGSDFKLPSGGVALYHESQYQLKDWTFKLGMRLDYEHVKMEYYNNCNTSYTIYDNKSGELPVPSDLPIYKYVPIDISDAGKLSHEYLIFLPKISMIKEFRNFNLSNVYMSIGKGYKAGGFNTQMFSEVLQERLMQYMGVGNRKDIDQLVSYKPEKSWNYEIGAHLNFPSCGLKTDVSLFYIDCFDQQMTVFPEGQTTGRMMTNAAKTRSFGGEISLYATPFTGFNLIATYGYTNARFVKFLNGINDYKGKRIPYAPSNTVFCEASYKIGVTKKGDKYVNLGINYNGVGDIYWNEANTLRQKFYSLIGATLAYHSPKWSIEIYGKNLTHTNYYTFYFMSMGNEFRQKGNPVQVGVILRAKF